jgi:membrane protein involved in D-alanine export
VTPYADLPWFLTLLAVCLPAVALGLLGAPMKWYRLFATAAMLVAIFSRTSHTRWLLFSVALYFVFEATLVLAYAAVRKRWDPKPLFYCAVLASLAPLLSVKFETSSAPSLFAFLGISYLTFRCVEVLFELHDGLIPEIAGRDFFSFLLFFPTLSSGPIDRYRRFQRDHEAVPTRREYLGMLDGAVPRLFQGVLYKFVIAAAIQQYWLSPVSAMPRTLATTVSFAYAYGLHLFFDFAGYSALAVGTSYIFGIRVMDNFDKPFLARNIREFWNRWHISLSTWFRDFVFMRFALLNAKLKVLKSRQASASAGYMLSMGLMGVWHGLTANFILYGLYHGVLLVGYEWFAKFNKGAKLVPDTRLMRALGVALTVQLVFFGFLIFSGRIV